MLSVRNLPLKLYLVQCHIEYTTIINHFAFSLYREIELRWFHFY